MVEMMNEVLLVKADLGNLDLIGKIDEAIVTAKSSENFRKKYLSLFTSGYRYPWANNE